MGKTIILGSGIAGISAGYHLKLKGIDSVIYEKDNDWGGLCGNFTIKGFRFDKFVHFSFTKDEYINNIFEKSSPMYSHPSISYNYYNGSWLKHPAITNLSNLNTEEKTKIIIDFVNKKKKKINNYEDWLKVHYGNYFAENFPMIYTKKYWGLEAKKLETKWIGNRIYSPNFEEVLKGAFEENKQNFYYTNYMKYPKKGGFRSILNDCRKNLKIEFNKEVIKIDTKNKIIYFKDNTQEQYDNLISSLPLPEITKMILNCPKIVKDTSNKLHWTCGYQVSLGFSKPNIAKYLWFYIYNKDILASRVYSPSLKSIDNVPDKNYSSLQAEIFFDCKNKILNKDFVLSKTIDDLKSICSFTDKDILVKDIRFEKYANVTFTKDIYKNRKIILDYLQCQHIKSIGKFGQWDYLWTFQAFQSGIDICKSFY